VRPALLLLLLLPLEASSFVFGFSRVLTFPGKKKVNSWRDKLRDEREKREKENSREERTRFCRKIGRQSRLFVATGRKKSTTNRENNKIEKKSQKILFDAMGAKSTFKIYSAAAPTNTHNVIHTFRYF